MYFEQYGNGNDVYVGLHGWSGDHTTFAPLVPYLPKNVILYSADLPGYGKSQILPKADITSLSREIAESISKINTTGLTLIGNCSGGLLALFAIKHLLQNVRKVILIDPFAYLPIYFKLFVSPATGNMGKIAYFSTFANPIGRSIANLSLKSHRTNSVHLTRSFSNVNHSVTYSYLKLFSGAGTAEQFKGISMPIDLVFGEKTFSAIKNSVRHWKEIWPEACTYELQGIGHLPIEEAPEQVARIVFPQPNE